MCIVNISKLYIAYFNKYTNYDIVDYNEFIIRFGIYILN